MGYYSSFNNGNGNDDNCSKGPVRAVIVRAGRDVIRIETYAGPLSNDPDGGKDLGAVSARDAAAYLLSLAATLDGRPAREALQPAILADSAVLTPQLSQLARDQARARDVRSSAISWLARRRSEPGGVGAAAVQRTLDGIVRDHDESEAIRRNALSTVGNFDRGEGIPLLIAFAGDADTWIARQALSSLANSGDPRARQFVRETLRRSDLPEESRATVIRGVGNEYANASDYKLLRDLYPSVNTDQERSAIINVVGNAGGTENVNWLLGIAKSPTEPAGRRRQAVSALSRNDDPRVKDVLKGLIDR
jgi:HEAT repeat protein